MRNGAAKTEFVPGEGTASNWLDLWYNQIGVEGCQFDAEETCNADECFGCPGRAGSGDFPVWGAGGSLQPRNACGGSTQRIGDSWLGCIRYDTSPYFELNNPGSNYWVIVANEEPSFDQCREGPPGLSHKIVDPINQAYVPNLFKVAMEHVPAPVWWLPMPSKKRAHLIINASDHDFYCSKKGKYETTLPFLSLGAQQGKGNNGPVAVINRSTSVSTRDVLRFRSQIWDYQPMGCLSGTGKNCNPNGTGAHAGLFFLAEWGGKKRVLFLDFFGDGAADYRPFAPIDRVWNWPVANSFMFPGADLAYLVAGTSSVCGLNVPRLAAGSGSPANGPAQTYSIDLSRLFKCASDQGLFRTPMPNGNIDVTGVHWFLETVGQTGYLWLSVEDTNVTF